MPKIEAEEKLFFSLAGRSYTDDELSDIFPVAKAELDGRDGEKIKIELNDTNRPDLWSAPGVARALRTYETEEIKKYDFFSTPGHNLDCGGREIINDESIIGVRDFSVGFATTGCKITNETLISLIQSQEKICFNFGRKRKTIAIGLFRSDLIKYPITFATKDPDETKFVPLGMTEELSLREILEKHPKGKEYAHLIKDLPRYPYLFDSNGDTLSFPPIINSARIGAVEVGDEDLYFEASGPILEDVLLAASIFACDMADLGFTILPVKVKLAKDTKYGREIACPFYFQTPQTCTLEQVKKTLGEDLSASECITALRRMGVEAKEDKGVITVKVPEYRNDFLHAVDIIEDIMIGHGLKNFKPIMPTDFTKGYISEAESYARKVKTIMVGMGFQEMMYNYLGSKKEYVENMHISDEKVVYIANPMSENYEVVRPSILPSLLESESVSLHAVYPHNIFEIGKVTYKDERDNSGTVTKNHLGFMSANNQVGYNDASSYVQTLMYYLDKTYSLREVDESDGRFIPGRAAKIIVNGVEVGVFGEVHPQVLDSWGCAMPAIGCEIDLDMLH